jgi:hypothetical protein
MLMKSSDVQALTSPPIEFDGEMVDLDTWIELTIRQASGMRGRKALQADREYRKRLTEARKAQGLCVTCGREPIDRPRSICRGSYCLERYWEYRAEYHFWHQPSGPRRNVGRPYHKQAQQ